MNLNIQNQPNLISKAFIGADKACDYIPVLSLVTNLVDVFAKGILGAAGLCSHSLKAKIQSHHYTNHLSNKKVGRCFVAACPIIGNIAIGIYDYKQARLKQKPAAAIQLKIGFPNQNFNCWLSTALHLVNAAPNAFVQNSEQLTQKDGETENNFALRKHAATLTLALLGKSKRGEGISPEEMQALQKALHDLVIPGKNQIPLGGLHAPDIGIFAYILEIKPVVFDENVVIASGFQLQPQGWSEDGETINPIGLVKEGAIVENFVEFEDGIPVLPTVFQGSTEEAPLMFEIANNSEKLDLGENYSNMQCLVKCSEGGDCRYELAACAIFTQQGGVGHYYAIVKETHQESSVWVTYNDTTVTQSVNLAETLKPVREGQAVALIFRKIASPKFTPISLS